MSVNKHSCINDISELLIGPQLIEEWLLEYLHNNLIDQFELDVSVADTCLVVSDDG